MKVDVICFVGHIFIVQEENFKRINCLGLVLDVCSRWEALLDIQDVKVKAQPERIL